MVALIRDEILEIGLSYTGEHDIDDITYERPHIHPHNGTKNC
jgi:hypothetical protein